MGNANPPSLDFADTDTVFMVIGFVAGVLVGTAFGVLLAVVS